MGKNKMLPLRLQIFKTLALVFLNLAWREFYGCSRVLAFVVSLTSAVPRFWWSMGYITESPTL